jgi:hypothetical protein
MARDMRIVILPLLIVGALMVAGRVFVAGAEESSAPPAAEHLMTSTSFNLNWDVAAGGGNKMTSASFTLLSTSGQPGIGESTSSTFSLTSGYWVADLMGRLFLPIIMRQ